MLLLNNNSVDYFVFSGGELQVKLPEKIDSERVILTWKPTDCTDIILLMLTVNALHVMGISDIDLDILYMPYARQDRSCATGEANSLQVLCEMLDRMDLMAIRLWDVHNELKTFEHFTQSWISNIEPCNIFKRYNIFNDFDMENLILCAPDKGAYRRVKDIADSWCFHRTIMLSKTRNSETGHLAEMVYQASPIDIEGYNILVIDDICDGGATFIEAAKVLKEKGAAKLYLYVTHGIFSKGLLELLSHYEHIICHHVLHDNLYKSTDNLTILQEHLSVSKPPICN